MGQQVVLTDEALRAEVALVGSAFLVAVHVPAEIIFVTKLFGAKQTLERFVLHIVPLYVFGQIILRGELLTAPFTLKLSLGMDPLLMLSQTALAGKEGTALVALVITALDNARTGGPASITFF